MGNNISHFIADGNICVNNICENKNCIKLNLPSERLNDTDNCIHEMINVRNGLLTRNEILQYGECNDFINYLCLILFYTLSIHSTFIYIYVYMYVYIFL